MAQIGLLQNRADEIQPCRTDAQRARQQQGDPSFRSSIRIFLIGLQLAWVSPQSCSQQRGPVPLLRKAHR